LRRSFAFAWTYAPFICKVFFMSRSSGLTAFSQALAVACIIQFGYINPCFSSDAGDHETKVSLHWFDGQSQLVEVDWKSTSHWVWKYTDTGVEPTIEIEIAIPAQIHINSVEHADNADFKIVEPSGDSEDSNQTDPTQSLAIETREPKIAAKLNIDSNAQATVDRGLLVTLEPVSTAILIHGSCANAGLDVHPSSTSTTASPPLYIGATCQVDKGELTVRWHLPEEFTVLNSNRQPLQDGVMKAPASSQKFLIFRKGDAQPAEYALSLEPKIVAEKPLIAEHQKKEEAKPRPAPPASGVQFVVAAAPAYLGYPSQGNSANNSSANNIDLNLHVEQTRSPKRSLWEADLEVPAFSIFPGPLHFPASGIYSLSGLVVVPPFAQAPDSTFAILAGVSLNEIHLELNSQASGFVMGPKVAVNLSDKTRRSFGGRAYSATLAAAPLWSPNRGSGFNGYEALGSFSFELSRHFFSGRRLDLVTQASYFNLLSQDGSNVGVTSTSVGLQLWL
jgi:hypothetical protein